MIKCAQMECVQGKGSICCSECNEQCEHRCGLSGKKCSCAIVEETTGLAVFQSKAMTIMQNIANLDKQKKQLEAQDKVLRQDLQKAMDKYGVKKFENDILAITYIEPTTRTTIDSARLKKELPAIAEKYSKTSQVKGSVRIEVK